MSDLVFLLISLLGIFLIFVANILLLMVPTIFNVFLTLLILNHTLSKWIRNKFILCVFAVCISLLIGFNIRLPKVMNQVNNNNNIFYSSGTYHLDRYDNIKLVTNVAIHEFEKYPYKTKSLFCTYVSPYLMTHDRTDIQHLNYEKYLSGKYLSVNSSNEPKYTIKVDRTFNSRQQDVINIEIINGTNEIIANSHTTYLNYNSIHSSLNEPRLPSFNDFISYLFQYNIWDYLLNIFHPKKYQQNTFDKLFKNTFIINNK